MKLSRRQEQLLAHLLRTGESLPESVASLKLRPSVLLEWQEQPDFVKAVDGVVELAMRCGRLCVAMRAPAAARHLANLCEDGKGETARKACLDVLGGNFLPRPAPTATAAGQPPIAPPAGFEPLPPGMNAASLLAAMAGQDRSAEES